MTISPQAGQWVPLGDAASRLGVPTHNLRLAIDGGLLLGRREDNGGWQVQLRLGDGQGTAPGLLQRANERAPREGALEERAVAELIDEQVRYLREVLERRDDALAEKDVLLADLARGVLAHAGTLVSRGAPATAGAQGLADERVESALRNVRETLLLVRDYLQRLRPPAV
jgi:hypothetical protein